MRGRPWAALALAAIILGLLCGPAQAQTPLEPLSWGENDPIVTFEDALLAFRPSDDGELRMKPRDALPQPVYFRWRGRITTMASSEGPHTDRSDPFRGSKRLQGWRFAIFLCLDQAGPFAFRDVRKSFVELDTGAEVEVIGRYAGAIQVEQPHQEVLTLPLLDNCYVR